jgi:hypothetical protein
VNELSEALLTSKENVMFVEITEFGTGKKITVNFSFVEYFRDIDNKNGKFTLIVLRGLDAETDDGMNRYEATETSADIRRALAEAGGRG